MNPLINTSHAGNAWASGLSQNRPCTPMLSELQLIRQLDWIHLEIVFCEPSNSNTIAQLLLLAYYCYSLLSASGGEIWCIHLFLPTQRRLGAQGPISTPISFNSMQKKTSKVLLLGLENPDDGNKSFSCFVHDRDWKVKHYCHLLSA